MKKLYLIPIALGIALIISAHISCEKAIENIIKIDVELIESGIYEIPPHFKTIKNIEFINRFQTLCYGLGCSLIGMNLFLLLFSKIEGKKQLE